MEPLAELPDKGRLIGVDVGASRVGLARTDPLQIVPSPIGTYAPKESLERIARFLSEEGPVAGFAVGWPVREGQSEGDPPNPTQELVLRYVRRLQGRFPGIPVRLVDEYLSSREAMGLLVDSAVPKGRRREKGRLDAAAACVILQRVLAGREGG